MINKYLQRYKTVGLKLKVVWPNSFIESPLLLNLRLLLVI